MVLSILVSLFSSYQEKTVLLATSLATSLSWFKVSDVITGLSHVSLSDFGFIIFYYRRSCAIPQEFVYCVWYPDLAWVWALSESGGLGGISFSGTPGMAYQDPSWMGASVSAFPFWSGSWGTPGISYQDTSWMGSSDSLGSLCSPFSHLLISDLNFVLTPDRKSLDYFAQVMLMSGGNFLYHLRRMVLTSVGKSLKYLS